jgi:cell division protein FtsI/penicillin-binding protein 2
MTRRTHAPQRFERRLLTGIVLFALVVALLAARLVQVQIVEAGSFREEARSQQERTLVVPATRGAILDREGNSLALTLPADARGTREAERLYPQGRLASQVVGATSADGRGIEGIELAMETLLQGRAGSRVVGANARGYRYSIPDGRVRQPEDGANVVLTLDATLQAVLERELRRTVESTDASAATGVLLHPRTGEVLAMATWPTYDPERARKSSASARRNRAITDIAEPGSTFKIVTAAACLEEGLVDRDTRVDSGKELELAGGERLRTREDEGPVTLEEMLVLSVNTATARFARIVGKDLMYEYARAFGVGCVTGIELPGEVSGILRRPKHWSGRSLETISIGQEVAMTPLQLASAYAAIANNGVMMRPHIVRETRSAAGKTLSRSHERRVRRVLSARTAHTLTDMLTEVVESGTGQTARVPGVLIAGKTGTAQRVDPVTAKYDPSRHVASFAGFFPSDAPEIVGVVVIDRPAGEGWGAQIAAPCFRRVVEGILFARSEPPARGVLGVS